MLAYSGKGRFVVEDVDINALVQDMSSLLASTTSKNAMLRYELSADLPGVRADATQLRQIVLNLVSNASDALGEQDGVVAVETYMSRSPASSSTSRCPTWVVRSSTTRFERSALSCR